MENNYETFMNHAIKITSSDDLYTIVLAIGT